MVARTARRPTESGLRPPALFYLCACGKRRSALTTPSSPMAEHVPIDNGLRPQRSVAEKESLRRYWRSNLRIMAVLLTVWFVAGLGCGVLWADWLNEYTLPGTAFPLGFWFAQQGSIVVFVLVILIYCILMNRLDRKHHDELVKIRTEEGR